MSGHPIPAPTRSPGGPVPFDDGLERRPVNHVPLTPTAFLERAAAVDRLAEQLVAHCGAPDVEAARAAAEEEVAFAESLCDHEPNTLLGLQRICEGEVVRESFRTLHRRASRLEPLSAFRFVEVEEETPAEEVDLVALARKAPR